MTEHMLIEEFVNLGLLHELNRRFLHPLGLAMDVEVDGDGNYTIAGIWDCRNRPEGLILGEEPDKELPRPEAPTNYDNLIKMGRLQRYGWIVQPVEPPEPGVTFAVVKNKPMPRTLGAWPEGHPKG